LDNKLNDQKIYQLTLGELLSREIINELYDISDELERVRLKAVCTLRARELGAEKDITAIFKVYDKAEKRLIEEFNHANAEKAENSSKPAFDIPLLCDNKGRPLCVIENFLMIIRGDVYFESLKFNQLAYSPEKTADGKITRWTDADDAAARNYIESKYNLHHVQKLDDALRIVFAEREYHPIKDIIEAQEWDGIERIPEFLIKWMKCEDTPYTREVSRLIFSGGINRLYNPGCKFDDVPVLIGTQGEGKSTFIRWLALRDEFYTEATEIEGQRGIEALEGVWVCELGELLALTKAREVEAVKSYITRQVDRYRRPFDKRVTDHKRQCVFIGTTNREQFLTDKTGNRRFYPVSVRQTGYDLFNAEAAVKSDILQCWAEAKIKFDRRSLPPFADRSLGQEIRQSQQGAVEDDYRDGLIQAYIENLDEVCILELWQKALDNGLISKPTRKETSDISLFLKSTGKWERSTTVKRFGPYGVQRYWYRVN
jgi:predicted P-loop ATPase